MKKSFCDICGENSNNICIITHYKGIKLTIYPAVENKNYRPHVILDENPQFIPADLCKKCARELLDKIEL